MTYYIVYLSIFLCTAGISLALAMYVINRIQKKCAGLKSDLCQSRYEVSDYKSMCPGEDVSFDLDGVHTRLKIVKSELIDSVGVVRYFISPLTGKIVSESMLTSHLTWFNKREEVGRRASDVRTSKESVVYPDKFSSE